MDNKLGGKYLSLPHYEGHFKMPGINPIPTPSPEDDRYTRDGVMDIMDKAMFDQEKMYNKMQQTMDRLLHPLQNSIAWISKTMEELQQKLDYTERIIQRQQDHITKGEEAIKNFDGTWFENVRRICRHLFPKK